MKKLHIIKTLIVISMLFNITLGISFAEEGHQEYFKAISQDDDMHDDDDADEQSSNSDGGYIYYENEQKLAQITGTVVLDFYADWCPSCRKIDADIKANLDAIPSDMTIVKVDYSNEKKLRKKYKVTTQHTFVQIDSNGEIIKKWSGGSTLQDILDNVEQES